MLKHGQKEDALQSFGAGGCQGDGSDPPASEQAIPSERNPGDRNIDEVLSSFAAVNPLEQEGYVVIDEAHRRIKVKHPLYVAIHHMRSAISKKAFLEVVRAGETPEVIAYYPELTAEFEAITADYQALCREADLVYASHTHLETQKEFALAIGKHRCSAALFKIRAGHAQNAADFYAKVPLSNLMRLLGYKDEEGD